MLKMIMVGCGQVENALNRGGSFTRGQKVNRSKVVKDKQ